MFPICDLLAKAKCSIESRRVSQRLRYFPNRTAACRQFGCHLPLQASPAASHARLANLANPELTYSSVNHQVSLSVLRSASSFPYQQHRHRDLSNFSALKIFKRRGTKSCTLTQATAETGSGPERARGQGGHTCADEAGARARTRRALVKGRSTRTYSTFPASQPR